MQLQYLFDQTLVYTGHMLIIQLIYKVGNESHIFVCLGEPLERGARGIFNKIIKSMENLLESNVINLIMKEVSSLVTDGTSVNTGNNYGLWKLFQDYRLEKFSEPVSPLLTI